MTDASPEYDAGAALCHVEALTGQPDTPVTFQTFDDNADRSNGRLARIIHGSVRERFQELSSLNAQGAGIFITVNPTDARGRSKTNITGLRAVSVEFDGGVIPTYIVPPSFVVQSKAGEQAYWNLKPGEYFDIERFEMCQRRMIERLRGDPKARGVERVLRLAGFDHQKVEASKGLTGSPYRITFNGGEGATYTIDDLTKAHWVAATPSEPAAAVKPATGSGRIENRNSYLFQVAKDAKRAGGSEQVVADQVRAANAALPIPLPDKELDNTILKSSNVRSTDPTGIIVADFKAHDIWNADRFVEAYSDVVKFVPAYGKVGKWLAWNGVVWTEKCGAILESYSRKLINSLWQYVPLFSDAPVSKGAASPRDAFAAHLKNSSRWNNLESIAKAARSYDEVQASPEQFDADRMMLNCPNGVVDLTTGEMVPRDKKQMFTKVTKVNYNKDAICPAFEAALLKSMAGDTEMVSFLQRAVGYSITGSVGHEVFFILWGEGGNGKGKFYGAIEYMMGREPGGYAHPFPVDVILKNKNEGIPCELAELIGIRFAPTSESGSGRELDEAKIKKMTGGDTQNARRLYGDPFTFQPQFKIWYITNDKPVISATDEAMWRRLIYVPFTVIIPPSERNQDLAKVFEEEAEGILAWAVRGWLECQKGGLRPPVKVLAATQEYRDEEDSVGEFLASQCAESSALLVSSSEIYAAYKAYAETPVDPRAFGNRMRQRKFVKGKAKIGGRSVQVWHGVCLFEDTNEHEVSHETLSEAAPVPGVPGVVFGGLFDQVTDSVGFVDDGR